jgi:hypothetical protein
MHHIENDATNNSSAVACVFIAVGMCLLSSWLAMMGEGIHTDTEHGDS